MRRLGSFLFLAACGTGTIGNPGGGDDAGSGSGSGEVDRTPPRVVDVTPAPGGDAWLHGPIRFTFDEPIVAPALAVSATLAGAPVDATAAVDADDRSVLVTLDPAARGVGELAIEIEGVVQDRSGNNSEDELATSLQIAPWSALSFGTQVSGAPAIAIGKDGSITAAWLTGAAGARRAVVSDHAGELGTGDVTEVALALDDDGRPIVAYVDAGGAHVVGWDATAGTWIPLGGGGPASHVALASDGGAPVLALSNGATVTVKTLEAGVWQPIGAALAAGGAPSELAVAHGAVAWVEPAGARVHRLANGAWAALPILGGATRISIAARGDAIAAAWQQRSGSDGIYAASAADGATAWTRLGGLMDVDPNSDARAPQIALDADGAPIVAWAEQIEMAARGVTAKWNGSAWSILGGASWLAGSGLPAAPRLALGAERAPAIAWTEDAALHVARFNGPAEAGVGIDARVPLSGCSFSAASPAPTVLATGCFTAGPAGRPVPHAGLVPYDLVSELWTDGTKKRRWIALPDGAAMTSSGTGAWDPPAGSVVIKEFAVELAPGDPGSRRAVETRFLVKGAGGWQGFTYQWRSDGSDADLLNDGQYTKAWPLSGGGTYTHLYPSRSQCLSCHEGSFGPMLGLRTEQLRRWFDYNGVIADQLGTLQHLGIGPSSGTPALPSPHDASISVEMRTRGYMAANCAHCHNPNHISIKDMRFTTPLAQTRLCEVIVPGRPANSRLHQLVTQRPGMPALGSLVPDPLIGSLVNTWITGMTSCP